MKRTPLILSPIVLVTVGALGVSLLLFQTPTIANAQGRPDLVGKWDRLNPDPNNPTPEHEVLRCGGNTTWHCVYDKQPEPRLGFENPPDSTFGRFRGEDVSSIWTCPDWFPSEICDNWTFVAGGAMEFLYPDGSNLVVDQELVVIDTGGGQMLYVYWVDQFACPWFRSLDEALAANPFPTPFNGEDWPELDCVVAP